MRHTRMRALAVVTVAGAGLLVATGIPAMATVATSGGGTGGTGGGTVSAGVVTSQTGQPALAPRVQRPAAAASAATVPTRARGARATRPTGSAATGATVGATTSSPVANAALGRLLQNFNGTSSKDSQFTNFNATFEPPDQGLCAGAGFVLEPVNSAYRIYRTNGTSLRGPFNVNEIFDEGGKEFTSDPRCWYDPTTHAWFATILFLNSTFTEGRIDIAVNPSSDPTGLWTEYQIDTTFDGRDGEPNLAGCPCFGDQPRIGIDQTNLYVTTDEFSINGPQFYGGQIYAISKADLVKGVPNAHFVRFGNLRLGGAVSGAPQPALSIGTPDAEYFLSSLDPNGTGDHRIGLWAMTNRGKVATGGSPTLSKMVVSSEAYSLGPPAQQRGSTSTLDPGDDRMQQASYVGGTLWGELGTGLRPAGDSADRTGIAWFQLRPHITAGELTTGWVRQGYLASAGHSLLYPAIQPDAAGNAAMVFTLTGKDSFPSAAYAVLSSSGSTFGAPVVAAAGTGPYDKTATRWGDYSFAVPDWSSDSAWFATEYVPPAASQTTTKVNNWGTRVIEVRLS
jgi:hypothetical protein